MLNSFAEINFVPVLIAAIAYFMIGWLWYSPMLCGKAYMKELKIDCANMKMENMGVTFGASFICGLLTACVIKTIMVATYATTPYQGANVGLLLSVGLVVTNTLNCSLYDQKSTKLFLINSGYNVVGFIAMGAILGVWS